MPTRVPGVVLVQTTDFFYPNVEDPYEQGRIACANVLSDLYSMGVAECDNMLMLLGVCTDLDAATERQVVTRLMIQGFHDQAATAGCSVTGGQTVLSPWMIIGGVASCVCAQADVRMPVSAAVGDVLVLTKPLGTQVAANAHQWLRAKGRGQPVGEKWDKIKGVVSEAEVVTAFAAAQRNMTRLNRNAAKCMHEFGAHASTDVTGFGLLGHAQNLAGNQLADVAFRFHTIPVIRGMLAAAAQTTFKLREGLSAETSGGLLVALPREQALLFIAKLEELDHEPAWIIGDVIVGTDNKM